MIIAFYEHRFSSNVQKAKTAFYEKGIPFETEMIDGSESVANEFAALCNGWRALVKALPRSVFACRLQANPCGAC